MIVAAIDPGLRACGVSLFVGGRLLAAGWPRSGVPHDRGALAWVPMGRAVDAWLRQRLGRDVRPERLIVECPQSYVASRQKGDQNDLIELAGVIGVVIGMVPAVRAESVKPREWKGTLNADVMIERIKARLGPDEHRKVELPSSADDAHNVYDAIGIGLHALGRLTPAKVYPR